MFPRGKKNPSRPGAPGLLSPLHLIRPPTITAAVMVFALFGGYCLQVALLSTKPPSPQLFRPNRCCCMNTSNHAQTFGRPLRCPKTHFLDRLPTDSDWDLK